MVRVPLFPVEDGRVAAAVAWLEEHWKGGVDVPEELLPLVAA
jgi:hypothetical protein